jgi:hypothetical protein
MHSCHQTVESYVLRNRINSPTRDKNTPQPSVFWLLVLSMRRSTDLREIIAKVIANLLSTPHYFLLTLPKEMCSYRQCLVFSKIGLTMTIS